MILFVGYCTCVKHFRVVPLSHKLTILSPLTTQQQLLWCSPIALESSAKSPIHNPEHFKIQGSSLAPVLQCTRAAAMQTRGQNWTRVMLATAWPRVCIAAAPVYWRQAESKIQPHSQPITCQSTKRPSNSTLSQYFTWKKK